MTQDASSEARSSLPPNQSLVAPGKWPLVGEKEPNTIPDIWRVSVSGLIQSSQIWTLDELSSLPQVTQPIDIHCVTRWSKLGARFGGVPLQTLLHLCSPLPEARYISFVARSARNHSTSLPLPDALDLNTLIALTYEDAPLEVQHGGPIRTVVPERYFYKSLKWLERIELLAEDRLGYWEAETGYHNTADPWREERYIASNVNRNSANELLRVRNWSGMDLLGIEAAERDLSGLIGNGALLRNANFRRANLECADLRQANLSNAHLEGANLRGASLIEADVEGANFSGADLRGADFTGASLFGCTFTPESENAEFGSAQLDTTTRIELAALDKLTPIQQAYVTKKLVSKSRE